MRYIHLVICFVVLIQCISIDNSLDQAPLPPVLEWHGKSENLIYSKNNPWITPCELSNFTTTPSYKETFDWISKLCSSSTFLHFVTIGISPEGRAIKMIVASTEKSILSSDLKKSTKPLLLVQAGIHAGEIDGKDAGMMLLRDIALGKKKELIDKVNFLFIPILSVDAHERNADYNRPNQRGPESMGWRIWTYMLPMEPIINTTLLLELKIPGTLLLFRRGYLKNIHPIYIRSYKQKIIFPVH